MNLDKDPSRATCAEIRRKCDEWLERRVLVSKRERAMRDILDRGRAAQAAAREERKSQK